MRRVFVCALTLFLSLDGSADGQKRDKLSQYLYEDTKQLVALVEDAASLIEQKGEAAFPLFQIKHSKWLHDQRYLFIYDLNGKRVFHPIEPGLVGQDLTCIACAPTAMGCIKSPRPSLASRVSGLPSATSADPATPSANGGAVIKLAGLSHWSN